MSKYWQTTFTVTVLSESAEPPHFGSVENVAYEITDGHCSGAVEESCVEVTKEQMRELLGAQGSDPDFLILEDEGDDA